MTRQPSKSLAMLLAGLAVNSCAPEPETRWWKGNLHTHSLWSDGDDYPETIVGSQIEPSRWVRHEDL